MLALAASALACDSAEADKSPERQVHPQIKVLLIPISQAKRCRFVGGRGEREHRSGWRKLALEGSRTVWKKRNICSSQPACSVPPVWGGWFVLMIKVMGGWSSEQAHQTFLGVDFLCHCCKLEKQMRYCTLIQVQCVIVANWPKISAPLLFHSCHGDENTVSRHWIVRFIYSL